MRTPRRAARVVVLDPAGAVFLFHYDDTQEVGPYWATPGGGLEADETPRQGALRELREETGWYDLAPGPLLCTWEHDYTRKGVRVRQHDHLYLAYGPRREPAEEVAAMHLEDEILRWHWWTPQELAATTEALWPPRLPELLAPLRTGDGRPPEPVDLGYTPPPTR